MPKPAAVLNRDLKYLYTLLFVCVCLAGLYVYFMSASILHVVAREDFVESSAELASNIATLEAEYMAAQHNISEDIAYQEGFVAINEKIFLSRKNDTVALSYVKP